MLRVKTVQVLDFYYYRSTHNIYLLLTHSLHYITLRTQYESALYEKQNQNRTKKSTKKKVDAFGPQRNPKLLGLSSPQAPTRVWITRTKVHGGEAKPHAPTHRGNPPPTKR